MEDCEDVEKECYKAENWSMLQIAWRKTIFPETRIENHVAQSEKTLTWDVQLTYIY